MINNELSTEENLDLLFQKIDNMIERFEATNQCDDSDRKNVSLITDDISYYV
jgi:hypothetical protein